MSKHWEKLLARDGVDLTTVSEITPRYIDAICRAVKNKQEALFTTYEKGKFTHYIAVDNQAVGLALFKKYFNSPEQISHHYREGKKLLAHAKREAARWQKILKKGKQLDFKKAFQELRKEFSIISEIYTAIGYLAVEAWQKECEVVVTRLLERNKITGIEREHVLLSLYQPWKKTALLRLHADIGKGLAVATLVKRFQFLRTWTLIWHKPIGDDWIKNMSSKNKEHVTLYSSQQVLKLLKPNKAESHFLTMAPYVIFLKDFRDDLRREHVFVWTFLWEALARRWGCQPFDLGYLTLDEISSAIDTDILPTTLINKRKINPSSIVTSKGIGLSAKIYDIVPDRYQAILQTINQNFVSPSEITGTIAQRGKVVGRVFVLNNFEDIKKMRDGYVLVANTTHPNFLPAMQRAAAFVTNEGGIMSHAAIVARELKKPCIVNTKIATKVFKDGDLVEVDAEKGIVKKI